MYCSLGVKQQSLTQYIHRIKQLSFIFYDWIRFLLDQKKANVVVVLCYMALLLPLSVCRQNCSSATISDLVNRPFGILITMNFATQ